MRAAVALGAILMLDACAALSGLSNLSVDPDSDGGKPDVTNLPDVVTDGGTTSEEASIPIIPDGRAGYALKFEQGCSGTSGRIPGLSFSDKDFTVSFWLQVHALPPTAFDTGYVLGQGQPPTTDGWSVNLTSGGLHACAGDKGLPFCSSKVPLDTHIEHLLHVVVISVVTMPGTSGSRSMHIYLLDATNNETTHQHLVNHPNGGANNWNDTSPYMMGGVTGGSACTDPANVTIDEVRLYNVAVNMATIDGNYKTSIPCTDPGLVADFKMDEGKGNATSDCTSSITTLLTNGYTWVPSPFP